MASGDYASRSASSNDDYSENDFYYSDNSRYPLFSNSTLKRDSPTRRTRPRSLPREISPSTRSNRLASRTITIEQVRPASKGNTLLNPFIFIPYIIGLVVIIYYSCVGLWIGTTWLLSIWPYIAKSDLLPPLANIAGIIQGIAIIVGSLLGILKLFNQRQKS